MRVSQVAIVEQRFEVSLFPPAAFYSDISGKAATVRRLACSSVHVQADELNGALVWRPAGLAVLHMLPLGTVSEGVAVSYQVDLVKVSRQVRFLQLLTK